MRNIYTMMLCGKTKTTLQMDSWTTQVLGGSLECAH